MKYFLFFLPLAAIAASCHHVYYAPNTPNIPMLTQKGETRINANYVSGADSEFEGAELQIAHAVKENFGLMANYFTASRSEAVDSYTESGKGSYFEAAAGYMKTLDPKKKWVTEFYGGLGFGSVKNEYENRDFSNVGITKLFLQPSLSYKSAYFEVGFTPKLSLINWKVKDEKLGEGNDDARFDLAVIKADPSFFAFEPALLIRAGGKGFKIHGGLSFSNYNAREYLGGQNITETLTGSLGISIDILPTRK